MKKLSFALPVIFLLCAMCSSAFAQQTFSIDEINAEISFPDGYTCITGDDDAGQFVDHQYLIARSADSSVSCSVTCLNSSGADYLSRSDDDLQRDIDSIKPMLEQQGASVEASGICHTDGNTFIVVDMNMTFGGSTVCQRQYSTMKSNLYLNITFMSDAPFNEEQYADMLLIAESLRWQSPAEATYSETELKEAHVSFLYPDNWLYEKSVNHPFTYHSYLRTGDDGIKRIIIISYANAAPYLMNATGITDPERMDIGTVSKSILAYYVIGVDEDLLQEVEINGEPYYMYRLAETQADGSESILYQYFYLRNGMIYMFQFDRETDDMYYPVFETLLDSIVYS